ncbi:TspO/MBR family protein [Saccharothrix yanglingensis]|uniref:Tryptophan-rich sensory protein n=1 Tax=Saccharothrix yanglingensis TaxID=659496 RepID=A0ABU0WWY8_9PSEU|nr:TspO/MBR family protein [Saccharothrix yanglingensis]MDQ2584331.1 tryptophan-rich sensory protein [Saccharothrix yanglingensis]
MTTQPAVRHPLAGLAVFAAAVAAAAVVGSLAATSSAERYQQLDTPSWAPPPWLFGPVWTVLYIMIAVSGWLFWKRHGVRWELGLFAAQLVLNAAWTPLFFAAQRYALALVDIIALLFVVVALVVAFGRRHRPAALLLVPYLAWVGFATALNAAIVSLN